MSESCSDVIDRLRWLKDDHPDEIPSHIVHKNTSAVVYKVQKIWWQALLGIVGRARLEQSTLLSRTTKLRIAQLIFEYSSQYSNFGEPDRLTTAIDIAFANMLIERIIMELRMGSIVDRSSASSDSSASSESSLLAP